MVPEHTACCGPVAVPDRVSIRDGFRPPSASGYPQWRFLMKRFLGFAVAMFFALVAIALVGGDSGAVAGHGCHGGRRCHGGLLAKHHAKKCHGGLLARHRAKKCHGAEAAADCGACGEAAADCGSCGAGCGSCGGAVEGGCAGGACGGEGVISEGVPTEAAPAAPAAPAKT